MAALRKRAFAAMLVLPALATAALSLSSPALASEIFTIQLRPDSQPPGFPLLVELDATGAAVSSGPVFAPLQGIYGLAFLDEVLYGSEFDSSNGLYYLASLGHTGGSRGIGSRVSGNPFGAPAVEGLAVAEGVIYATSLRFSLHDTVLATVDPVTGAATPVGQTSRNVMIVGLAYDPVGKQLYGAGVPFGAGEPNSVDTNNLYTLDMATGQETFIGELGVHVEGLAWDENLGLIGSLEALYTIDMSTGAATPLGSYDLADGQPGTFNGGWGLAAIVPPDVGQALCGDANSDGNRSASDALIALQTGVGAGSCLACICDVNLSGGINATDSLLILQFGVGQPVVLSCPTC